MTKVSFIILNWNRPDDTIACIESLKKLNKHNVFVDIFLIDNGSTDNSVTRFNSTFAQLISSGNLQIIENPDNLGFAMGNNIGIRKALQADSDYIVLLNNDTLADPEFLSELLKTAKTNPRAGCLVPKIYFAPGYEFHKNRYKKSDLGKIIWYAGGDIDWNNIYCTNHGVDEVDTGQYSQIKETDFATGACLMLTKYAAQITQGFDERYYMYLEDVDLSRRLKKDGFKILFIPEAKIWHKVAQSSSIGSNLNDYFITRNRLLFGMRYAGLRTRFALYRESLRFLINGRNWQKRAVLDFYFNHLGKGSWK